MGGQNPDYLGSLITPDRAWTLAQLWTLRAMVEARCGRCQVRMRVDIDALVRARGPDYSLWNKTPRCRVVGCPGRVTFWAKDRHNADLVRLKGEQRHPPLPPPRWLAHDDG